MKKYNHRIVVRIEISTLSNEDGKFDYNKMDRLAMVLSNLNNSGKEILVVSSGAIALGCDKLGFKNQPESYIDMQATAAIGQAELIKFYQRYFDEYNQMVAQVLLTSDIMENQMRVEKTLNTFNTLLKMNIIPIVNENDVVSLTDIKLDDNYPLAYNVARITKADIILIKTDTNSSYILQPRGSMQAILVKNESELFEELDIICNKLNGYTSKEVIFPEKLSNISLKKH